VTTLNSAIAWTRTHALWLTLAALPLILAACNNGTGGGTGY